MLENPKYHLDKVCGMNYIERLYVFLVPTKHKTIVKDTNHVTHVEPEA